MPEIGNEKALHSFGLNTKHCISLPSFWVLAYLYPLVIRVSKEGQQSFKLCTCLEIKPLFIGLTLLQHILYSLHFSIMSKYFLQPYCPILIRIVTVSKSFFTLQCSFGSSVKSHSQRQASQAALNGKEGIPLATNTLKSFLLHSRSDESLNSSSYFPSPINPGQWRWEAHSYGLVLK